MHYFDGTKSIPLHALPESAWRTISGQEPDDERLSPRRAFRLVPWVHRAVDLRAKAIASMPYTLWYGRTDVTMSDSPEHRAMRRALRRNLYLTEASVCLNAASYLIIEPNIYGFERVRWLVASSIEPKSDPTKGLTHFMRRVGSERRRLELQQVIYVWTPSLDVEVGPGIPVVQVAMAAAGVLANLDELAAAFFKRGAIKPTLLSVEGNPGPTEIERLEKWWKRLVSGVKNAFDSIGIRAAIKPVVIGSDLKDVAGEVLTTQKREDICTGIGVPHSIMMSNAATFATANQDGLNFYMQTVIPQAEAIEESYNEQWLEPRGYRLEFTPKKLEVMQQYELAKAGAVAAVSDGKPLTRNEGRELLGYDPIDEGEATEELPQILGYHIENGVARKNEARARLKLPEDPGEEKDRKAAEMKAQLSLMAAATAAGYSAEQAAEMAGLPPPEQAPAPALPAPGADPDQAPADNDQAAPGRAEEQTDLGRYQRKATKALRSNRPAAVRFDSDYVAPELLAMISHELEHATSQADIKSAFKALALELTDLERSLADKLIPILRAAGSAAADAILAGETDIDLATMDEDLRAALYPHLVETILDQITELAEAIGPDFDPADVATAAGEWAEQYSFELVKGINATTRTLLQKAISRYQNTPGMNREQLEALLRPAFGEVRGELIAVTENTRAASQATNQYQRMLADGGIELERVWHTSADDIAAKCQICGPLNGKPESEWPASQLDGPPGHIKCRCFTTLRRRKKATAA